MKIDAIFSNLKAMYGNITIINNAAICERITLMQNLQSQVRTDSFWGYSFAREDAGGLAKKSHTCK